MSIMPHQGDYFDIKDSTISASSTDTRMDIMKLRVEMAELREKIEALPK